MLALVAALTVTPWMIRNVSHFGRVTVADAGWGLNLLYGTIELTSGSNRWEQLMAATPQPPPNGVASFDVEEQFRAEALRRIRANPAGWLKARLGQYPLLFINSGDYLPIELNRISFRQARTEGNLGTIALKLGFLGGHAVVVLLSAYGLWTLRRRVADLAPVWSFPVFLSLAHVPMYVEPRYGLPLAPFVAMFAAVGMTTGAQQVVVRRSSSVVSD